MKNINSRLKNIEESLDTMVKFTAKPKKQQDMVDAKKAKDVHDLLVLDSVRRIRKAVKENTIVNDKGQPITTVKFQGKRWTVEGADPVTKVVKLVTVDSNPKYVKISDLIKEGLSSRYKFETQDGGIGGTSTGDLDYEVLFSEDDAEEDIEDESENAKADIDHAHDLLDDAEEDIDDLEDEADRALDSITLSDMEIDDFAGELTSSLNEIDNEIDYIKDLADEFAGSVDNVAMDITNSEESEDEAEEVDAEVEVVEAKNKSDLSHDFKAQDPEEEGDLEQDFKAQLGEAGMKKLDAMVKEAAKRLAKKALAESSRKMKKSLYGVSKKMESYKVKLEKAQDLAVESKQLKLMLKRSIMEHARTLKENFEIEKAAVVITHSNALKGESTKAKFIDIASRLDGKTIKEFKNNVKVVFNKYKTEDNFKSAPVVKSRAAAPLTKTESKSKTTRDLVLEKVKAARAQKNKLEAKKKSFVETKASQPSISRVKSENNIAPGKYKNEFRTNAVVKREGNEFKETGNALIDSVAKLF